MYKFRSAYSRHYLEVKSEIANGKKCEHWMWFMFPQLRGLGHSEYSFYYGLTGLSQAREFYEDAYLGPRFVKLVQLTLKLKTFDKLEECFGPIDTLKYHSSMTLFWLATHKKIFKKALDTFFNGKYCERTERMLGKIE